MMFIQGLEDALVLIFCSFYELDTVLHVAMIKLNYKKKVTRITSTMKKNRL